MSKDELADIFHSVGLIFTSYHPHHDVFHAKIYKATCEEDCMEILHVQDRNEQKCFKKAITDIQHEISQAKEYIDFASRNGLTKDDIWKKVNKIAKIPFPESSSLDELELKCKIAGLL